jgi:hypothetical protein
LMTCAGILTSNPEPFSQAHASVFSSEIGLPRGQTCPLVGGIPPDATPVTYH